MSGTTVIFYTFLPFPNTDQTRFATESAIHKSESNLNPNLLPINKEVTADLCPSKTTKTSCV